MVHIRSFPHQADPSSTNLLSEKDTVPFGSVSVTNDDICSLLGSLSISTDQLRSGATQAGLGTVEVSAGRRLDPQMDLDSIIPPSNGAIKIEPPSNNPSGTRSSVEWYQQLLATTRDEIQTVLKKVSNGS